MSESTDKFLASASFAVAGASQNKDKYGYKVFRALIDSGREVYPLNPTASQVDGVAAYPNISDLSIVPESLSIVTPPVVTRRVVEQAIAAGVKNVWMQPGAEDDIASEIARAAGLNVIDDGSCVLVALSYRRRSGETPT